MTDTELENQIRDAMKTNNMPDRASLTYALIKLDKVVTELQEIRYTEETTSSDIINRKITSIVNIWRSKRISILIPSFIVLFIVFIGAFTLSPQSGKYHNENLEQLAEQDEAIEGPGVDYDDPVIIPVFEEPVIDDLSTIQNEI